MAWCLSVPSLSIIKKEGFSPCTEGPKNPDFWWPCTGFRTRLCARFMGATVSRVFELFSRRIEKRVVLLGLDNAGKTTAVYRLLLGKKVETVPTVGESNFPVVAGQVKVV